MKRNHLNTGLAGLVFFLSACMNGPLQGVSSETIAQPGPAAAAGKSVTCQAIEITPAVIETVTQHILVSPAALNPDGSIATPARYKTQTQQVITRPRKEIRFETPCPEIMTPEFIASLQRALKARGQYSGPITGVLNTRTRQAILDYQSQLGLNSSTLSVNAARRLGLITYTTLSHP